MKKYFLFYLFLSFFSFSRSCVWAQPNNFKPGPNTMIINLEASTQKFELPVKEARTKISNELIYYWYKSNQILQTKGGYDGKLLHGAFSEFYLNNNLKEKGKYIKGLKNGEWKSWYKNGQLKEIAKYCKGLYNGKFQSFNENGELILEANYKKGKLHGPVSSFENGKIKTMHKFKKGNEVFPKPKKINAEKKKKFHWKFWKGEKIDSEKEANPKYEKPSEQQPENKPVEKEKDNKKPVKNSNSKEPKTSNG